MLREIPFTFLFNFAPGAGIVEAREDSNTVSNDIDRSGSCWPSIPDPEPRTSRHGEEGGPISVGDAHKLSRLWSEWLYGRSMIRLDSAHFNSDVLLSSPRPVPEWQQSYKAFALSCMGQRLKSVDGVK